MLLSLGMNDELTVVANSNCNDENFEIEVLEKVRHLVEVLNSMNKEKYNERKFWAAFRKLSSRRA